MARPLRIAVVGSRGIPSAYSGVEQVVESLYTHLAARGHQITVYGRRECAPDGPVDYRGIRVVGTRGIPGRSSGTVSQVMTSVAHILRRGRYDLVHTHAQAAGLAVPLLRGFGLPVVSTIHGIDWQRAKWEGLGARVLRTAERWILRRADEVIVISRDLESYYRKEYSRATRYIPNATDLSTASAENDPAVLARFGLRTGEYIVSVSRLVPEKRIEDLIAAYRQLDTQKRLVIVGGSSHTDDYVAELQRLGRNDSRIVFTGALPRREVAALLGGASLYVLPSELEGMPISLLEALERGIPSIVSRIPVHEEILGSTPGYDLFFQPGDVDALRSQLGHALSRLPSYRQVASVVQAHVRDRYTWPAIAEQTESLYYDLIDRRRKTAA